MRIPILLLVGGLVWIADIGAQPTEACWRCRRCPCVLAAGGDVSAAAGMQTAAAPAYSTQLASGNTPLVAYLMPAGWTPASGTQPQWVLSNAGNPLLTSAALSPAANAPALSADTILQLIETAITLLGKIQLPGVGQNPVLNPTPAPTPAPTNPGTGTLDPTCSCSDISKLEADIQALKKKCCSTTPTSAAGVPVSLAAPPAPAVPAAARGYAPETAETAENVTTIAQLARTMDENNRKIDTLISTLCLIHKIPRPDATNSPVAPTGAKGP
jgi:hypothetical protein